MVRAINKCRFNSGLRISTIVEEVAVICILWMHGCYNIEYLALQVRSYLKRGEKNYASRIDYKSLSNDPRIL